MKVLIITNIPTPYRCAFFSELNRKLQQKNHDLHVIFASENENNRDWDPKSFEYDFEYTVLKNFTIKLFNTYFHINFNFIHLIRNFKPSHTIIAGSWNMPIVMFLTTFYSKLLKIKLFWSESHILSVRNTSLPVDLLRKFFYKKFNYFLVPNNLSGNFVYKYFTNAKLFILPNTVNQKIFKLNNSTPIQFSKLYTYLDNKINVVQVSQLEDRKGVIDLINSFTILPPDIQNKFNLIIVGNGSLKSKIHNLIQNKNNIHLINYLNQTELSYLYNISDFFVLSSFKDPNPLSPIEAVFSGKISFISKFLGNSNELIPDSLKDKLIFDPSIHFEHIFYSMVDFKNDTHIKHETQLELYNNVLENWDVSEVSNKLIYNLNSIINEA